MSPICSHRALQNHLQSPKCQQTLLRFPWLTSSLQNPLQSTKCQQNPLRPHLSRPPLAEPTISPFSLNCTYPKRKLPPSSLPSLIPISLINNTSHSTSHIPRTTYLIPHTYFPPPHSHSTLTLISRTTYPIPYTSFFFPILFILWKKKLILVP